jgi:DNA-binding IclR family transcriptional regulator
MLAVRMEIGARLPLSNSASGLCLIKASTEGDRRVLLTRIRATLTRRRAPVAAFEQRVNEALTSPVVIVRDTWHKGIGGVAIPVSNGSEIGAITIPIATSNVSEKEMRGPLSDMILELVDRHQLGIR